HQFFLLPAPAVILNPGHRAAWPTQIEDFFQPGPSVQAAIAPLQSRGETLCPPEQGRQLFENWPEPLSTSLPNPIPIQAALDRSQPQARQLRRHLALLLPETNSLL